MADTSISQLQAYTPTAYPPLANHSADLFVIVDTIDQSMANSGSDKKMTISQVVSANGILDIAFAPVAQGNLIYRDASSWAILAPGTSGYLLATQSTGANPHWVANSVATITGAAPLASPTFTGTVTISTASNLVLSDQASTPFTITTGTTYGTKIGGATSQKIGFYNTTPVIQPSGDIIAGLTNLGLIASPQITHWTGGITTLTGNQSGTALNLDCTSTNAFLVNLTTGATPILTVQNLAIGQTVKITLIQPGSGSVAVPTWATSPQTIRWSGGTAPSLTTTLGNADTITLYSPSSGVIGGALAIANF